MKMNNKKFGIVEGGIEAFTVVQNTIWGVSSGSNALIKISMDTWTIEYIAEIPVSIDEKTNLFSNVFGYNNKLIFVPRSAEKIWTYDIKKQEFSAIELDYHGVLENPMYVKEHKFAQAVVYGENLFLIACAYPAIIKLNLENNEMEYVQEPLLKLDEKRNRVIGTGYFQCVSCEGEYIYAACCSSKDVLKYSMKDGTYELIDVDMPFESFRWAICDKDTFIIEPYTEHNFYWYKKGREAFEIEGLKNCLSHNVINHEDEVYIFSYWQRSEGNIVKVDKNTKNISYLGNGVEGIKKAIEIDNVIYAITTTGSIMYSIENDEVKKHYLSFLNQNTKEKLESKGEMIKEGNLSLQDFIDYVVS